MKDVDYLSTVSGGGFVGGFISSLIGSGAAFDQIAFPFGPDSGPVQHLRQNAKYLHALNLKQRWLMISGTLSGLILNWTARHAVADRTKVSSLSLLKTGVFGEMVGDFRPFARPGRRIGSVETKSNARTPAVPGHSRVSSGA
jgi:hypothetical protein